jgi:poly-gamma-glutamate capsule biosynthesis protein CapA/YwtB (metallophosphatase superfamily)
VGTEEEDPISNVRIGLVGDVCVSGSAYDELLAKGPEALSLRTWAPLADCDLIIANLEAPITSHEVRRDDKPYSLRMDEKVLDIFDGRFVLNIANNHMMDFGDEGLRDTEAALAAHGIEYVGAGENVAKASRPVIREVRGVRVGVLGAADPRSSSSSEMSAGTFPAELRTIEAAVQDLRTRADIVVVTVHAGTEFVSAPSPFQFAFAEACQRAGADIVHYHHAHRISGMSRADKSLVLYGTGNYIFPYLLPRGFDAWYRSAAWIADVKADDGVVSSEARPVTLDENGIPRSSTREEGQYILKLLDRYSRRIERRRWLGLWRAREVLSPVFVRLAITNYGATVRAKGVRATMRLIVDGIAQQIKAD